MDDYDELEKAMNIVDSQRKSKMKVQITTHISVPLFKINKKQVTAFLGVTLNKNTQNFWLSHGLTTHRQTFCPTTQKREWTEKDLIIKLNKNRENTKKQNAKRTKEQRAEYYQKNKEKLRMQDNKRKKKYRNKLNNY